MHVRFVVTRPHYVLLLPLSLSPSLLMLSLLFGVDTKKTVATSTQSVLVLTIPTKPCNKLACYRRPKRIREPQQRQVA